MRLHGLSFTRTNVHFGMRRGEASISQAGLVTARSDGTLLDECLHFLRPKSGLREHIR